ncbi:MAG TPA: 23S rRNA (adenine(2503)-C(2))-methyltransferase RlmN [Tepidisphaeraceae bacterium]|nr:23S rRNA (adenine(2503)-C(2))-methyltransferase RlmN [Tepidisphaeraceae bacterium]
MPRAPDDTTPIRFFDLDPAQFDQIIQGWNWPRFRGKQVREWVYGKLVVDPKAMTNLAVREQEFLRERILFAPSTLTTQQKSSDGTQKLLLAWEGIDAAPGASAETVMIPDDTRRTACVSSQVGCPVGCKFCASGIGGVKGNLSAGQIVEQVFRLNTILDGSGQRDEKGRPQRINHIVFMGMGEPLANYANVMQAIRVLHDPQCFNIGARKITISTVGVPARMRQLAGENLPINLAISLHAPNEELRQQLIPWAQHFALADILDAGRYYFEHTGREVTLEYILLAGVNDQPRHARELARVCKTLRANVNLIRYNPVAGLPFERPKADDVMAFQEVLRSAGVNAHTRKSRGRDIDAACGQLRRKKLDAVRVAGLEPEFADLAEGLLP